MTLTHEQRVALSEHDTKILCGKLTGYSQDGNNILICLPIKQTINAYEGVINGDISFFVVNSDKFGREVSKDELIYRVNILGTRNDLKKPIYMPIDDFNGKRNKYEYQEIYLNRDADYRINAEVKEASKPGRNPALILYKPSNNTSYLIQSILDGTYPKWRFVIGTTGNEIRALYCNNDIFNFLNEYYEYCSENNYWKISNDDKHMNFQDVQITECELIGVPLDNNEIRKSYSIDAKIFMDDYTYWTGMDEVHEYTENEGIIRLREYIIDTMIRNQSMIQENLELMHYNDFFIKL